MPDRRHDNNEELIAVRTHLTVALLSLELLQRRHALPEDALRLCSYTAEALAQIKDELTRLDAVLEKRESPAAKQANPGQQSYRRDAANAGDTQSD